MTCDQFQITEVCNILIFFLHVPSLIMFSIPRVQFCLYVGTQCRKTHAYINTCILTCIYTHTNVCTSTSPSMRVQVVSCSASLCGLLVCLFDFKLILFCISLNFKSMARPATNGFWASSQNPRPRDDSIRCQWQMQSHKKRIVEPLLLDFSEQQNTLLFAAVPHFHCSVTSEDFFLRENYFGMN